MDEALLLPLVAGLGVALLAALLLAWVQFRGRRALQRRLAEVQATLDTQRAALQSEAERRAIAETDARRVPTLEAALQASATQRDDTTRALAQTAAQLQAEREGAAEKLALLDEARKSLSDAFSHLSSQALQKNNESFLALARTQLERYQEAAKSELGAREKAVAALVKPIQESLGRVDGKLGELEQARVASYAALNEQLKGLVETHLPQLHRETASLVTALRTPTARGRWGEVQLKRVVEMAGMVQYCDFTEQTSSDGDGGRLRPDLLVRLPGDKRVVVDAKAPLDAYLRAAEASDEAVRQQHLTHHARQVRTHIQALGRKAYWEQFSPTPEFVVLFLPGENFFSAALEQDPSLIEYGVAERVIPATPTTLIALLRAVSYGWRQEALAKNAEEIAALGRELYERIRPLAAHWNRLGDQLGKTVDTYNKATASLETRVLVSARKLQALRVAPDSSEIDALDPVEHQPRALQADDWQDDDTPPTTR